jgi:hypothetical protein
MAGERGQQRKGPPTVRGARRSEGRTVTLEPHDAYWARIFYGLDPDGYELMFEEHHPGTPPA